MAILCLLILKRVEKQKTSHILIFYGTYFHRLHEIKLENIASKSDELFIRFEGKKIRADVSLKPSANVV